MMFCSALTMFFTCSMRQISDFTHTSWAFVFGALFVFVVVQLDSTMRAHWLGDLFLLFSLKHTQCITIEDPGRMST